MSAPGTNGLELLRIWIDQHRQRTTNKRLTLLLGAFRGQSTRPLYRFARGGGSFRGPYYGIDQPSDKLTLDQFRNAILELRITMPLAESEAIFTVMADSDGLIGITELMKELRAEPCDASNRRAASKVIGQHASGDIAGVRMDRVAPTMRSGYTPGGYRAPPPPPKLAQQPHRTAPKMNKENFRPLEPDEDSMRVMYDRTGPFANGSNVLRSTVGESMAEPPAAAPPHVPQHRKAPTRPPTILYPRRTPSAFANEPGVRAADADPQGDSRFRNTDKIGYRRPPPPPPVPPGTRVAPSMSGFTHQDNLFPAGGEAPQREAPPPPPAQSSGVPVRVLKSRGWVGGYTRSERIGPDGEQSGRPEDQLEIQARKEAWARASPFAQGQLPHGTRPYVAPPDSIIVPTQRTGFTSECSQDASEAMTAGPPGSKCAMCRLNEGWKAVDIS